MIDLIEIHSHILPGLDDGASDLEESIAMARDMIANGITDVIATPHHQNGQDANPKLKVISEVRKLNQIFRERGIDLNVHSGQEVRLHDDLLENYKKGYIQTLAGSRYLLLELPHSSVPMYACQVIFEARLEGLVPVIAHPERNGAMAKNMEILRDFVNQGALAQVTASSLLSKDKSLKNTAMSMISEGLVSFISSDAHSTGSRGCDYRAALAELDRRYGPDAAKHFSQNGAKLLKDENILLKEFKTERRSFFRRFFNI